MLHLGIAVMSPGLTEFTLAMWAANLAFVSGSWLRGLVTGPDQPALRVLYDGPCPRCRISVALITAADPAHVIEPVDLTAVDLKTIHPRLRPEECLRSMHAVSSTGRITAGFDAVRSVSARLPLFWPLAALASLPGVASVGRRVYNRLAVSRPRDVSCTDTTCGVHSGTPRSAPNHFRGREENPSTPVPTLADSHEVPHP